MRAKVDVKVTLEAAAASLVDDIAEIARDKLFLP